MSLKIENKDLIEKLRFKLSVREEIVIDSKIGDSFKKGVLKIYDKEIEELKKGL